MSDKSILHQLSESGQQPPRVQLKGSEASPQSNDRYQIVGEIARGGVGVVYKGRDSDLGRDVAMKLLRDEHLEQPELIRRFVEEAQIGGQLQHPGIVPVYELGMKDNARPFFAMKLVKGRTLSELLREREHPGDRRRTLLAHFHQVCQTVAYAHSRGVIHRDLKPSNVMVGSFGEVQVVDWGFAKVLHRGGVADERRAKRDVTVVATVRSATEGSASVAGSVMGTPPYMPPEQALGHVEDLTERADVFALGAILCEILTGAPPYVGTPEDVFAAASLARLEDAHGRLDACAADDDLIALAKACLSPLPKDRPRSAREVADVVSAYLANAEARTHQAKLRAAEAEAQSQEQRRARRHAIGVATAAILVVLLGGAAWFAVQRTQIRRERERIGAYDAAILEATRLEASNDWSGARAAAEQARALASGDAPRTIEAQAAYERIQTRERAVADAKGKADAEARLLARLDEIGLQRGDDFDDRKSELAYAAALPDLAALGDFDRKVELARIFDNWVWLRRNALGRTDWHALDAAARMLDPDPWRNRLRDAAATGNAAPLLALANEPETGSRDADSLALLGQALKMSGEREVAVRLLRQAYERDPADFWVNVRLATYTSAWSAARGRYEGSLDDGIAHYLAALAVRPTSAALHANVGNALHQGGDLEGAIAEQRQAIRLDPGYASAYSNLGALLVETGDLDGAIEACRESIRLDPDDAAAAHINLAVALGYQGNYEAALVENRNAVRLDPDDAEAQSNLGATLHVLGDLEGAIAAYREALRLDPDDRVAAYNIVLAQTTITRKQRVAKARPRLAAVLAGEQQPEDAGDCLGFAALCYEEEQYEAAARFYRQAFQQDPGLTANLATVYRYRAACAAAHAGTSQWRTQAVAWLRADLELWASSGAPNVQLTLLALAHWKRDPDLASIRDGDDLPEECRNLWADVEALRTRLMTGASK